MLKLPDPNSQSATERLKPFENANPKLHYKSNKREVKSTDEDDNVAVSCAVLELGFVVRWRYIV